MMTPQSPDGPFMQALLQRRLGGMRSGGSPMLRPQVEPSRVTMGDPTIPAAGGGGGGMNIPTNPAPPVFAPYGGGTGIGAMAGLGGSAAPSGPIGPPAVGGVGIGAMAGLGGSAAPGGPGAMPQDNTQPGSAPAGPTKTSDPNDPYMQSLLARLGIGQGQQFATKM